MTKKQKQKKQQSVILKTFGALRGIRPALTPQQEREAAAAIQRVGGKRPRRLRNRGV
jgi:hypothetical protein